MVSLFAGLPVGPFARLPGRSFEEAKTGGPVCPFAGWPVDPLAG